MNKQVSMLFVFASCLLCFVTFTYASSCPVPNGDWDYCALCGPCGNGEGDCDSDSECKDGLRCHKNIGDSDPYYLRKGVDLCIGEETGANGDTGDTNTSPDTGDTSGIGTPVINSPSDTSQSSSPTTTVPDSCDDAWYAILHQDECNPAAAPVDTTSSAGSTGGCKFQPGDSAYCWSCGPCGVGEGICNNNGQCAAGLVCQSGICQQP